MAATRHMQNVSVIMVTGVVALGIACRVSADIIHVPDDYPTIQEAIDAASDGDEVVVADGTYTGAGNKDLSLRGKAITVRSENGPQSCIIDCEGSGRAFTIDEGETPETVVEGLTITNGYVGDYHDEGGGMLCAANPTIRNCTFLNNHASFGGGGIRAGNYTNSVYVEGCEFTGNSAQIGGGLRTGAVDNVTLVDCTFSGNEAIDRGGGASLEGAASSMVIRCSFEGNSCTIHSGGLYVFLGNHTITDCVFENNRALSNLAGAFYNCGNNADSTLTNCIIRNNSAATVGGGIASFNAILTLNNCLITENQATSGGAIACTWNDRVTATNCTIAENAADDGCTLSCTSGGTPNDVQMVNCILWNGGDEIWNNDGSSIAITYSDVQGGYDGVGNIDANPLFVDPDDDDFHFLPGSPCIDAGDNTAVPEGVTTDLDGNPRFVDDPDTEDTGFGAPPIVDMGAYEFQVEESCPADFDEDGDVDTADLLFLLAAWGTADGDVDGDNDTDTADLLALLAAWGECP